MKHTFSIFFISFVLIFSASALKAQKTVISDSPQKTYNQALQLFNQENYGAAALMFDKAFAEIDDPANAFAENSAYYSTVCAVYLNNRDALKRVKSFADSYPESAWIPAIHFELGKLYYATKKYKDALISFREVKPGQLSKAQRAEYYFKKGFCELKLEKESTALKSFQRVTGYNSSYNSPARYYIAHIYYNQGKYQKALDSFEEIENDSRFRKYVPNYMIHIYYELGEYQRVIDEGTTYLKKADNKTKGQIAGLIANAYYNLGDYSNALESFDFYERTVRKEISPDENYRIGYTKFINGKYTSAIYNFQEASKGDPSFAQNAWYHLGFCYLNTNEAKFAQSAFLKAYKLKGNNKEITTDALYNYVKVTIDLGSDPYNDPVGTVEQFIAENQDLPRIDEAYDLLAQLYLTSRKYKAALESIEKNRSPNRKLQSIYQQIAYTQGIDFFNRGDFDNAIYYFEKSLYYTPDKEIELNAVFWYADALYRLKRYAEATKKYKQFLGLSGAGKNTYYGAAVYNLAYTFFNQKQYNSAIDGFNGFLRLANQDINLVNDAKLRLADSYYIKKNYSNALKWYNQVVSSNGNNAAYAIYQKAFCYGAQGDFNKKISTLKELVSAYPNSPQYDVALYEIASTSLILKDQRSAIVYFDKLVKERPNSSYAKKSLVKMGLVYYSGKQYDQAIKVLKQVVNKYPASLEAKEALNTLQNVYMDMGQVDKYFAYAKGLDFIQVSTSDEDSLTFVTGENFYMADDCANAIPSFERYLQKFPNGGFVLLSYNYLSNCYDEQGAADQALSYYEKIIAFPDNQFTDKALLMAARIEFDRKNYQNSFDHYQRLNQSAEDQGMILEARDGAMRCAYLLENFEPAKQYAEQLLSSPNATEGQVLFGWYILAKSSLAMNNLQDAERGFSETDALTSGEMGAEAKYQLALIRFNKDQLGAAENLIYEIPDQYPDFDYWIAKGFILLADIYVAKDNQFQAEQTLLSVIENYPGEDLKTEARLKLEKITPKKEVQPQEDDEIEIE